MENKEQSEQKRQMTQDEMLREILVNSRKTRQYTKWQMIITIAFVVLPLAAALIIVPFILSSLSSVYSGLI